ncbi:alpha/beta fold hydrolase [Pseudarthrobacter sp. L19]|uniref:alpha/beta fold hydrolase n=1 Tax=Pseudarthrobacter sp. L19 TaxID=3423951 RepID=UPI003D78BC23
MPARAEVVLVHGLWHQPRHFTTLVEALRSRGLTAHTPHLHRGSLAADTDAVQSVVDSCGSPPLVLGHSYGGSVITGLERISHLLYVAAFVPATGESGASLGGPAAPINSIVEHHDDGTSRLQPESAGDLLYADCSQEDRARATALLVPQRAGHGRGVPARAAWLTTPSTYIVCLQDRALDPALQSRMARRCTTSHALDSGHSPFLSQPGVVADAVVRILSSH